MLIPPGAVVGNDDDRRVTVGLGEIDGRFTALLKASASAT